ncbi:gp436 family protein [Pseudacidovorax intermedius]|uniref:gp436 family protein n=1 Tax=Pseudacidovorax intermedius TaxID=433924 RepID=UPI0026EA211F|nr:phage protein Gp36 family protein [Pseudacidovorax intermedius]
MTYATPLVLLDRFDAGEIAQRVDRSTPRLVDGALLQAAAAAADLGDYSADEQAAAAKALAIVQRALDDARDNINGYISGRYTLPLTHVPQILERLACDLARYYLYDDQVTDPIKARFDTATKLLKDVADGRAQLGAELQSAQQPASQATAEVVSAGTVWGRKASQGFV